MFNIHRTKAINLSSNSKHPLSSRHMTRNTRSCNALHDNSLRIIGILRRMVIISRSSMTFDDPTWKKQSNYDGMHGKAAITWSKTESSSMTCWFARLSYIDLYCVIVLAASKRRRNPISARKPVQSWQYSTILDILRLLILLIDAELNHIPHL